MAMPDEPGLNSTSTRVSLASEATRRLNGTLPLRLIALARAVPGCRKPRTVISSAGNGGAKPTCSSGSVQT